jgi:hypothetical protein
MGPEDSPLLRQRKSTLHYHGDTVRILFLISAIVMLIAETTGASLPLTTFSILTLAILLVVAAGITNPAQTWIHYINIALAVFGTITFGLYAIREYQATGEFLTQTYIFAEVLALILLVAVYYATKTVRGTLLRSHLS